MADLSSIAGIRWLEDGKLEVQNADGTLAGVFDQSEVTIGIGQQFFRAVQPTAIVQRLPPTKKNPACNAISKSIASLTSARNALVQELGGIKQAWSQCQASGCTPSDYQALQETFNYLTSLIFSIDAKLVEAKKLLVSKGCWTG